MAEELYADARARIAAQRGRLLGWRPLPMGEVAVVAADVLGMAAGRPDTLGLRLIVAARDPAALATQGPLAVERALHKRGVLEEGDVCEVVRVGDAVTPEPSGVAGDLLSWPFVPIVVQVPAARLPAIAGLVTDQVPGAAGQPPSAERP